MLMENYTSLTDSQHPFGDLPPDRRHTADPAMVIFNASQYVSAFYQLAYILKIRSLPIDI